ncbi:MAG: SCO family protein [Saprospiraceae bacterium]|nr:SCO family protein [Saprospiraceae bacterium]
MNKYLMVLISVGLIACGNSDKPLPYLGDSEEVNGEMIHYQVPEFSYLDQDSNTVSNTTLAGQIYVADLFFTSCPSICPKVKQNMLRINKAFEEEKRLAFLSLSIDYRRDSIPVLKRYSQKLGIDSQRWHLVQLQKEEISQVANQYFNVAFEDENAPGGFDHSGRLILVDPKGHIRAHCDGTDPESVDGFIQDIDQLLHEVG